MSTPQRAQHNDTPNKHQESSSLCRKLQKEGVDVRDHSLYPALRKIIWEMDAGLPHASSSSLFRSISGLVERFRGHQQGKQTFEDVDVLLNEILQTRCSLRRFDAFLGEMEDLISTSSQDSAKPSTLKRKRPSKEERKSNGSSHLDDNKDEIMDLLGGFRGPRL